MSKWHNIYYKMYIILYPFFAAIFPSLFQCENIFIYLFYIKIGTHGLEACACFQASFCDFELTSYFSNIARRHVRKCRNLLEKLRKFLVPVSPDLYNLLTLA